MLAPLLLAAALADPRHVVVAIADKIESRYVLPKEGIEIANELRNRAAHGVYDGMDESRLASTLTSELRAKDLHFDVQHDPEKFARLGVASAEPPPLPTTNHGFRGVEIREWNVAVIARRSMTIASAFAAKAIAAAAVLRARARSSRSASSGTASAGEALAFTLQRIGRATIVGEKSAGAGNGGGWVPVIDGFVVFIPTFRGFDPKTGEGWERVGILPDIKVDASRAVDAAHLAALRAAKVPDRWLLPLLELEVNGPAKLDGVPGHYEKGIEISGTDGSLTFLGASGIPRRLIALADGTFLIEDKSVPRAAQARLRFVQDGLELLVPGGRVIKRARIP